MKSVSALCAAAALYGGVHLYGDGRSAAAAVPPAASGAVYRLVADGDRRCTVLRGAPLGGGVSELRPAPGCDGLVPGIARARFWRERPDGSIAFSIDGTDAVVTFAAADGDGYESFRPVTPLLTMTAR